MSSTAFLFDLAVKTSAIFAVAWLACAVLRHRSASLRYAIWTCALGAVLVLPLLSLASPRWEISLDHHTTQAAAAAPQAAMQQVIVQAPIRNASWARTLLVTIWLSGVFVMLLRVAAGYWRIWSLFHDASEIREPEWNALLSTITLQAGIQRTIRLKRSAAADVPLSYGLFIPVIVLPEESARWTEDRRRIVLLHELIHLRRFDPLWSLLAQMALAVNWFNPLAWFAASQLRREQERSCDDAVVISGAANTVMRRIWLTSRGLSARREWAGPR